MNGERAWRRSRRGAGYSECARAVNDAASIITAHAIVRVIFALSRSKKEDRALGMTLRCCLAHISYESSTPQSVLKGLWFGVWTLEFKFGVRVQAWGQGSGPYNPTYMGKDLAVQSRTRSAGQWHRSAFT